MTDPPQSASTPPPLFTWRVHPAARRPKAAALAGLVILGFSVVAALTFEHWGWGLLSAGVLLFSLNRFFLPSTYSIDEKGLNAQFPFTTRQLKWKHIRRVETSGHDILLAMNVRRTWLNANRELRVPFGQDKSKIVELIQSHLPENLANAGFTTESRSTRSGKELEKMQKADQRTGA